MLCLLFSCMLMFLQTPAFMFFTSFAKSEPDPPFLVWLRLHFLSAVDELKISAISSILLLDYWKLVYHFNMFKDSTHIIFLFFQTVFNNKKCKNFFLFFGGGGCLIFFLQWNPLVSSGRGRLKRVGSVTYFCVFL